MVYYAMMKLDYFVRSRFFRDMCPGKMEMHLEMHPEMHQEMRRCRRRHKFHTQIFHTPFSHIQFSNIQPKLHDSRRTEYVKEY